MTFFPAGSFTRPANTTRYASVVHGYPRNGMLRATQQTGHPSTGQVGVIATEDDAALYRASEVSLVAAAAAYWPLAANR